MKETDIYEEMDSKDSKSNENEKISIEVLKSELENKKKVIKRLSKTNKELIKNLIDLNNEIDRKLDKVSLKQITKSKTKGALPSQNQSFTGVSVLF